ncbi:IS66 family transposase [Pseudomonas sp. 1121_17]|uniref:IS66 family transposase n=1 Tax=Pseudomonas sp. 1121_17 TaxID=2604458 RepID=UPI004063B3B8
MVTATQYGLELNGAPTLICSNGLAPKAKRPAKNCDYNLNPRAARTRYPADRAVPIDNEPVENQIRPTSVMRIPLPHT